MLYEVITRLTLERKQQIKDIIMTEEANELLDAPLIFRTGHPAEGILEMTENEPFDLVVMGRKGRSNLANVLFGSTAERVFKHSTKPVLIRITSYNVCYTKLLRYAHFRCTSWTSSRLERRSH